MIRILFTIYAGLFGLVFGSFLNVCLSRWPVGESVVMPRSRCSGCGRQLTWWENVPLLSWLALRGRCRTCHAWIGWRHPLVELAIGVLWALSFWQWAPWLWTSASNSLTRPYGALVDSVGSLILLWLLVALAILDAENLWLPDWLTLPGIALGFIEILLRVELNSDTVLKFYGAMALRQRMFYPIAFHWLLGILAAAALILLIRWAYWLFRRREGIGLGDAKLMALLAAWLGLPGALLAFALGVVFGALVAIVLLAIPAGRAGKDGWALKKLPLGTFLCIGGIVSSLWGQPIIATYLHWAGL
jgi:leader peptidase (prepilin peptidase)/N-methyltransferase